MCALLGLYDGLARMRRVRMPEMGIKSPRAPSLAHTRPRLMSAASEGSSSERADDDIGSDSAENPRLGGGDDDDEDVSLVDRITSLGVPELVARFAGGTHRTKPPHNTMQITEDMVSAIKAIAICMGRGGGASPPGRHARAIIQYAAEHLFVLWFLARYQFILGFGEDGKYLIAAKSWDPQGTTLTFSSSVAMRLLRTAHARDVGNYAPGAEETPRIYKLSRRPSDKAHEDAIAPFGGCRNAYMVGPMDDGAVCVFLHTLQRDLGPAATIPPDAVRLVHSWFGVGAKLGWVSFLGSAFRDTRLRAPFMLRAIFSTASHQLGRIGADLAVLRQSGPELFRSVCACLSLMRNIYAEPEWPGILRRTVAGTARAAAHQTACELLICWWAVRTGSGGANGESIDHLFGLLLRELVVTSLTLFQEASPSAVLPQVEQVVVGALAISDHVRESVPPIERARGWAGYGNSVHSFSLTVGVGTSAYLLSCADPPYGIPPPILLTIEMPPDARLRAKEGAEQASLLCHIRDAGIRAKKGGGGGGWTAAAM